MANLSYIDVLRNAMLDEITAEIDAGTGAGKIRIYDGTIPADADTAITTQTLLAELPCSDPCAPAASGGVLTFSAITADADAAATGTASWFRIVDSDNNTVLDGDVTATSGGGDLELDSTSITINQQVSITSLTITEGNAT
jgi:hypothetical protein